MTRTLTVVLFCSIISIMFALSCTHSDDSAVPGRLAESAQDQLSVNDADADAFLERYAQILIQRNWSEIPSLLLEAEEIAQETPTELNMLIAEVLRASDSLISGNIADAEKQFEELAVLTRAYANEKLYLITITLLVNTMGEQGRTEEAYQILMDSYSQLELEPFSDFDLVFKRSQARIYQDQSEYLRAAQILIPITEHFIEVGENKLLPDVYGDLALLFGRVNLPEEAIEWHQKALVYFYANNDRVGIARTMNNLSSLFENTGEYDRMADSLYVAIEINTQEQRRLNLARNYYNLAMSFKNRNMFAQAAEYYAIGLELSEETGSAVGVMFNSFGIAEMLSRQNIMPDAAKEKFLKALTLAREMGQNAIITNSLRQLYEIEKNEGNYALALYYHEQLLEMQNLFQEQGRNAAIQELVIQHNVEQTRNENQFLSERLLFQETTSRNRLTIIVLLVIGLLLAVSFFVYAVLTKKRLEKAFLDIKTQQELLKQKNEQLEKVGKERDAFLNIIVHDLRNPLTVISSATEVLKDYPEETSMIQMIENAVKKTELFIKSLLNVFRMDKLNIMEKLELLQSESVVYTLRDELTQIAKLKNISLNFDADAFDFETHPESFHGILANLISNAIKYSPPYSQVWVGLKKREETFIVTVRDQGPGFSDQDLEQAFKPFARLSAKPTGGESSIGIGLYSVKTSTKNLRGEVHIKSPEEGGAEFVLEFPLRLSEATQAVLA